MLHHSFSRLLALGAITLTPLPVLAAEMVSFDFRLLGRSVPTASLAHFAETGEADDALAPYLRRLTPDQKDGVRKALTASRLVNLQHLSQWFYNSMGKDVLLFAGDLMQTEGRLNGQKALRAALIAAAAENGEISLLDVIEHFPITQASLSLQDTNV